MTKNEDQVKHPKKVLQPRTIWTLVWLTARQFIQDSTKQFWKYSAHILVVSMWYYTITSFFWSDAQGIHHNEKLYYTNNEYIGL